MSCCKIAAGGLVLVASLMSGMLWTSAFAESEPSVTNTVTPAALTEATVKNRLSETRALLEQGREEDAEKRIAQDARSRPQSADWYQEKAADFLRVAFSAKESGDTQTAQRAARLTLVQLDKAEKLSSADTAVLAAISELHGVIRERLLGTTGEAVSEYKKALELKADSPSVRQKLRQLDKPSATETSDAQK